MTLRNVGIFLGLLVAAVLVNPPLVRAAVVTTTVKGQMGTTGQGCLQLLVIQVGESENCMYNGGPIFNVPSISPGLYPTGESTGPFSQEAYYDSNATPAAFSVNYVQTKGDGKIRQVVTGTVSIDNNDTASATDDLISLTLTLRSPGTGDVIRQLGQTSSSAEDRYTTMTQVLAPYRVNFATPNASGGYDYVIGSAGFPTRLTFSDPYTIDPGETGGGNDGVPGASLCNGQLFGEMECSASFHSPFILDPLRWIPWTSPGSGRPGIGRMEGNIGARTVGTVTGLQCIDTGVNNACKVSKVSFYPRLNVNNSPGGGVTAEDVSWDELYLKVSTDANGRVVAMAGYPVQEYQVFGQNVACGSDPGASINCNSWLAEYINGGGVFAADDSVQVDAGAAVDISVMANDQGFTNPVTVTIDTQGTKGVATVSGSPGPASGISIHYAADVSATGSDTVIYRVTDGTYDMTATITLLISGAIDDFALTTPNTPVDINVAANDILLGPTAIVTLVPNSEDPKSFSNGGSATVSAGNGGPPAGIVVTYTPKPTGPCPTEDKETFKYRIDDGVLPISIGTVTVQLSLVPVATDSILVISTQGSEPLTVTGVFTPPGTGPGACLGNQGGASAVTVTADGTYGTAVVDAATMQITYTPTDPAFYHGTDHFMYEIQDADGETSSAEVTVTIPDVTPGFHDFPNIAADQDHYTTSLPIKNVVILGNGSRDVHNTLSITAQAQHGACAVTPANATGAFVYTPNTGYVGSDSCELSITDWDGQQGSVTANITVNPVVTVTPKVGGASADPWSLSLCAVVPFLRRRRQAALRRHRKGGTRRHAVAVAAALTALCGASLAAFGQTAPPEPKEPETKSTSAIGEIVVTARKVAENLKEVPLSITAFDSDTIAATGINSLGDVADLTPGLSFFNAFGDVLPVPVIRGVVPTDIFGQNNAAVFVDGVYVAGREGLNFDLLDVERIEVVKGPQSALYGRTAFSGAINYVSKRPSAELESKANLEFGSAGKFRGSILVSGPLLGETLRYRVSAAYEDFDGTYSNPIPGGSNVGGHTYRSYQGSLYWQPVTELEVNLGYYQSNDHIDDPAIVALPLNCEDQIQPPAGIPHVDGLPDIVPTPGVRLQNYCGAIPSIRNIPGLNGGTAIPKISQATGEDRDLNRFNLRIDWDLHELGSVSALSGFSFTHDKSVSDFNRNLGYNTPFLYCSPATTETPGNPNNCVPEGTYSAADQRFFAGVYNIAGGARTSEWSQELRFTSPRDQRLRYTGGLYWYKSELLNYPGTVFLGFPQTTADQSAKSSMQRLLDLLASRGQSTYGMPPFDASVPDFAIGTAIFYGTLTPDGGLDPLNRISEKDRTQGWAVFSGADFDLTDRLTLNGEARINQEHQQNRVLGYTPCIDRTSVGTCGDDFYNLNYLDPIYLDTTNRICTGLDGQKYAVGKCGQVIGQHFQLITGRLGLKYKLTDDWMAYSSVAYGEKPGGTRFIAGTALCPDTGGPRACEAKNPSDATLATVSPNPFGKESIIAYELGLKGVGLDRRVGVDIAVFYLDWKDIVLRQLVDFDPVTGLPYTQPTAFNVNAGSAHVLGTEGSLQVSFTDELRGDFTFGWTRAKIADARQDSYARFSTFRADCGPQPSDPDQLRAWWTNCNTISGDVSGNTLLRQPEYKGSASLSYKRPLIGEWDWMARLDATYQSGVYIGNDNESWLPAHAYVNAKLTLKSPKYSANFWVRNLLDNGNAIAAFRDIYWANTNNLYPPYTNQGPRPNFSSFVPLRMSVSYPMERTIGVNLEARFGAAVR